MTIRKTRTNCIENVLIVKMKTCQHTETSTTTTLTGAPSWSEWDPGTRHHRWVLHNPSRLRSHSPLPFTDVWAQGSCSWNIWISGLLFTPRVKPRPTELRTLLPSAHLVLSPRRPWSVSGISRPSCPGLEKSNQSCNKNMWQKPWSWANCQPLFSSFSGLELFGNHVGMEKIKRARHKNM